jgi:hypothetical protein
MTPHQYLQAERAAWGDKGVPGTVMRVLLWPAEKLSSVLH